MLFKQQIADCEDMISIFMQEIGVTQGDAKNHTLKTFGISTCIAVTLYDKENKVGAMGHFSALTDRQNLDEAFRGMLFAMQKAGYKNGDNSNVEVRVIGGYEGMSEEFLERVKNRLSFFGFSNFVGLEYARLEGEKIALDTRTGELFELANITPLDTDSMSEEENMLWKLQCLQAQLPYVHYTNDEKAKCYQVFLSAR